MTPETLACRRCLLRETGEEEAYRSVKEGIERLPKESLATEEVYGQRLSACRSCDHLLAGTCMLCGCYVELRAAVRNQECPARPRRWGRVGSSKGKA